MNKTTDAPQLALAGEVNIFNACAVRDQLMAALEDADDVCVDLSQVTEIDTAGVQLIVAAKREAAECHKELHFCGSSAPVRDVIGLLGLSAYLAEAAGTRA